MRKLKVLSLFDGISVAQQALKELGYDLDYYASEIDKYAIQITQKNHPNTIQVGDVTDIFYKDECIHSSLLEKINLPDWHLPVEIDLLIGGSPCQDLSIAKKNREGLKGSRSSLFWEYVRILKEVKPKYFVLENVASMPKEAKAIISEALGVEPIMINASLVSAQNRKRLFWTNIPNVTQPEDRGILLKDILESNVDEAYLVRDTGKTIIRKIDKAVTLRARDYKGFDNWGSTGIKRIGEIGKGGQGDRIYSPEGKSVGLSALGGGRGAKTGLYAVKDFVRKLTPIECERLQSLPDNYTEGVSNTQRYKALGNAFNKEVVKHILSFIK